MNDLMTLMVCVAVGVFSRLQRMNVQNEYVTPLRVSIHKWFERLSPNIQTFSTPHPGRVYDVTPLTLITFSDSQGEGRKNRNGVHWMKDNKPETKELIFAAIVGTTTGRMTAFYQWSIYRRLITDEAIKTIHDTKVILIPRTDEIQQFLEYLEMISKEGKMGPFVSAQFSKSFAPCFFNIEDYGIFLRKVASNLEDLYNRIITALQKKECGKEEIVQIMKVFLDDSCVGGAPGPFLVSQVIYNLDKMINLVPNKDWEKVVMGYGCKGAMSWIQRKGDCSDSTKCLEAIKESVGKLPDENLHCLGLKRLKTTKKQIVWAANLRLFGIQDSEHFLCKLWIIMLKRAGGRPSKNPKLHLPHVHPMRIEKRKPEELFGKLVLDIAKNSTDTFRKSKIKVPDFMCNW
jgi:hypothetical protein